MKQISFILCVIVVLGGGYLFSQEQMGVVMYNYEVFYDLPYGDHALQMLDIALPYPRPISKMPIYISIHGGGYTSGDKSTPNPFLSYEAQDALKMGCAVVSVNYRLAPEFRWPSQLNDGIAAIRKLQEIAPLYGLDANSICITGHSAGSHLAIMVGIQQPEMFGSSVSPIKAIVNYSAFTLVNEEGVIPNIFENLAETADDQFGMSPSQLLREGLPPILSFHGTEDEVIPYSQVEYLVRNMDLFHIRGGLVQVQGGNHVYLPSDPNIPISPTREHMAVIAKMFLRKHLFLGIPGDVDMNGKIDWSDFRKLFQSKDQTGYSVDGNGMVTPADTQKWNPLGDLNDDGVIDFSDIWELYQMLSYKHPEEDEFISSSFFLYKIFIQENL